MGASADALLREQAEVVRDLLSCNAIFTDALGLEKTDECANIPRIGLDSILGQPPLHLETREIKVNEMLDTLWHGRGGFIAGFYDDNPSIGLEPKWQEIASDEYIRTGVASRYL